MKSAEEFVQVFAEAVAAQTRAIGEGDARTGNKWADKYIGAFAQLRKMGDEGRDALAVLFHHHSADVRTAAAAFLLRHRHEEAVAVLEDAAQGVGLAAFEAGEALKRWEEGAWQLDPADEGEP